MLEEFFGWTGLCVEPNKELFRELRSNRLCHCVSCCLYDRAGEVDFLELAGVYGGIIENYDPNHLAFVKRRLGDRWPSGGPAPTVRKMARSIRSLLREVGAPSIIDYWSLDTEGAELAVLRSFPFDEFRFRVLTVEHNNTAARDDIRNFLESKNIYRVRDFGIDDGYVWGIDYPIASSWSAVWRR
jgi:hypothetical protein